jgi:predicted AAA+ superfamily ATPase
MYKRALKKTIESYLFGGKIIILLGPRQVGKTTLVDDILISHPDKSVVRWSGDNAFDCDLLSENRLERITGRIGKAEYIFIDEAQKIENIGNILKQLVDTYKKTKQIIVTGSSSFHILDQTSEALTGRKVTFLLYPISI